MNIGRIRRSRWFAGLLGGRDVYLLVVLGYRRVAESGDDGSAQTTRLGGEFVAQYVSCLNPAIATLQRYVRRRLP